MTASPANLYEAQISAKVGKRIQQSARVPYGYRSIRFDKDTGFYLNGIHTKLKGVCVHHDGGCIGAAENRSAIERQVDILTNMGCNAIRLTHNPFGAEYLDVCQRKGVLLVEELFDGWTKVKKQKDFGRYFSDHYAEVVTDTIRRDWNNPAVIMWSLGNEVRTNLTGGDYSSSEIVNVCTMMNSAVKALDSTRPTTMGNNAPGGNLAALMAIVDVVGINYNSNNQTYQTDRPIYGSETTSALSSRGVYATDSANMAYPSYDNKAVSWGSTAAETVNAYLSSARSCGHFVWTGFDYIGEPTEWNKYPAKEQLFRHRRHLRIPEGHLLHVPVDVGQPPDGSHPAALDARIREHRRVAVLKLRVCRVILERYIAGQEGAFAARDEESVRLHGGVRGGNAGCERLRRFRQFDCAGHSVHGGSARETGAFQRQGGSQHRVG